MPKNRVSFWLLITTLVLMFAEGDMKASAETLPADVINYLQRELSCDYFSGEEPDGKTSWDISRRKWLKKQINDLRCDDLPWDRNGFQEKYLCPAHKGFDCSNPSDNNK